MKTNDKPTSIQGEAEGDRAGRSVKKASRKSAFWSGALALGAVGVSAQSLKAQDAGNLVSVEAAQVLPDGSLSVVLSDGRSLSLSPDEYEIVDGAVVIDPPVAEALGLAGSGSGLSLPLLGGVAAGVVALVGGAVALADGGDSGGSGGDGSANEAPVFASGATATASVTENTETAVYTPVVTDADGDPLTFTLSGTDAALFEIDEQTGAVTFIDAPDYEAPGDDGGDNAYNIVITASDGTNSTDQDVTITVTDEEVEFTSGATASVAENAAVGTVVYTAEATTDTDGSTLTFALSGTDAALFEIDEQTGAVTLNAVPDYEAPGDADGDNAYNIVITASDGANSTDQAVTITVTNENDEVPVFASGATATASVPENTEAAVYTPTVTDADGDPLTFSLSGTDAALFNIDEQTGAVTFIDAPDYEAPGDDGGDNAYNIVITASDGTNSTDQDVTITVTDEEVEFTSGATASVAENAAVGTVVYTAEATTDTDGDPLTFSLSGTDAALFNIDEQTGAVTFIDAPDYEAPGDNTYNIVITASDGTNSTDQDVTITVTNENDEVPVFASGATATASVPENTEAAVYTPTVTDADGDPLTFSLSGTDAALFNIDEQTGAVTFIDAPDYEAPGDNTYNIVITASDGTNSTDQDVTITVTNEEVEFTSGATASVAENTPVETAVYTAEATTDTDGSTLTFALSGTDADLFNIDPETGAVTFIDAPDYEDPRDAGEGNSVAGDNVYDIVITASDGTNSTDQDVTITVTDVEVEPASVLDLSDISTTEGVIIQGDKAGDQTGYSVSSAGDVNGDGFDDLIVGAHRGDDGGVDAGEAYVLYGGTGLATIDLEGLASDQGFIIQGDTVGDFAGYSVSSAGDVNGDGFDDLIIGAPLGDDGFVGAGEAYVLYGGTGLASIDLTNLAVTQGFIIQGATAGDQTGRSVSSAGDVNGDGFDDLIVGAPNGDDGGNYAGEAYVIYGGTGLATIDLEGLASDQGFIIQGDTANDYAGRSVSSAGDVNGDGFDDLIVGAPRGDDGGSSAGEAYVLYGGTGLNGAGLANIDLTGLTNDQGFIIQGDAVNDRAGWSVSSAGDVNGDGFDDLIVGAPSGDDGGINAGEAYVIYGGATGTESTLTVTQAGTDGAADNLPAMQAMIPSPGLARMTWCAVARVMTVSR